MTQKKETKQDNKWEKINEESLKQEQDSLSEDTATDPVDTPKADELPFNQSHEDQMMALEQKISEHQEKVLLAYAELENVRKRSERDVQNAHRYANEKILEDLLPVIDSLVRAQEGEAPSDPAAQSMLEGIKLTIDLLEKTLARFGVEAISPERGDDFDPAIHEAMSMMQDPELKENTIAQVLQKGYRLNNRVIRAAMVMVSQ